MRRARSDLALARAVVPGVLLADLCYHARQAAEKAIKGVLVARGATFPHVHDLARLIELIESGGGALPNLVTEAPRLNRYATATRCPGFAAPVTTDDHARAIGIAEAVVVWAEPEIGTSMEREP